MLDFYQTMQQVLEQGAVVLATVVRVRGSVPREVGAKMLIWGQGQSFGTIGGGAGEAKVQRQALEVLATGQNQWVEIDLSGAPHRETQGVCGGLMQVWLGYWAGPQALALVQQINQSLALGQAIALLTPFRDELPRLQPLAPLQVTDQCLIEPLLPPPTLLIVGAGHVAVPLAQVAQLIGLQVIVVDDRPEFACAERFPGAKVLAQPLAIALPQRPASPLYVALVTRGYLQDGEALRHLLQPPDPPIPNSSLAYLGMIGSQKRIQTIFQGLQNEGYPAELLQSIHAPIGLEIGALTPAEIAVSIGAQLIQVRRSPTHPRLQP